MNTNKSQTNTAQSTDNFSELTTAIKEVQKIKHKAGEIVRFNRKDYQVVEAKAHEVHIKNLGIPFDSVWVNAVDVANVE